MNSDIIVALITWVGGIIVALIGAPWAAKRFMTKQMRDAQSAAEERRKLNHKRAIATRHLLACLCAVLEWQIFCMQKCGTVENGELEHLLQAQVDLNEAEGRLEEIERGTVYGQVDE